MYMATLANNVSVCLLTTLVFYGCTYTVIYMSRVLVFFFVNTRLYISAVSSCVAELYDCSFAMVRGALTTSALALHETFQ